MGLDRFCVVDVEGNGGSPPEIVELAMIELNRLVLTDHRRHWLVQPTQSIKPSATRIHGITDADLIGAPAIEDIAEDILDWLSDSPIVGHNVRIELEIMTRSFDGWRPSAAIDTLKLAKKLRPGLASYGLENFGRELALAEKAAELTGRAHHSALYDATLTALIFIHLLSPLSIEQRAAAIQDADILNPSQGGLL
ncbi:3'-5' exonuclease [Bradyrhizobium elkanii]|uniref:3'-5' exonuclease n=1 Tax=Bradyrhizobium elkanii TaxID=29448 RepID=A0A4U6RCY7_BRAEL|nr:3'-5' exonuclease [Bradyrhizobium elkanii]TKV71663.1 3'-5' exonuclease [Bradyrhizobium elkanii]